MKPPTLDWPQERFRWQYRRGTVALCLALIHQACHSVGTVYLGPLNRAQCKDLQGIQERRDWRTIL